MDSIVKSRGHENDNESNGSGYRERQDIIQPSHRIRIKQVVMPSFQGFRFVGAPIPRALPWAIILSAFQAGAYFMHFP
jgi:hypothetical protein